LKSLDFSGFLCYNGFMDKMNISLIELNNQLQALVALVNQQATQIAKQDALIQHYEAQLLYLKRRQFGASSERTDSCQLSIFENLSDSTKSSSSALLSLYSVDNEEISYKRKKRKGKRDEDLSHLPVVRVEYELPEDEQICPSCDADLHNTGKPSIRREIEIIPAQAIVKEHTIHAYTCKNPMCFGVDSATLESTDLDTCDNKILSNKALDSTQGSRTEGSQVVIRANAPKPLIMGSLSSPSLVAHIAYQKYGSGMPLYRIEKGFQYDGVSISRQNMSNWVIKCVQEYFMKFYNAMKAHLLAEDVIHSDGTVVQVLREEGRAAQTKSCQWVYRSSGFSDKKIVIYEYTQTKGQVNPKKFLPGTDEGGCCKSAPFSGYLHCDGDKAYKDLSDSITLVGCWAHARRYFEKIVKPMDEDTRKTSDAAIGLAYINSLFKLERDFDKQSLSYEDRHTARIHQSKPIVDEFFEWITTTSYVTLPQSLLGKALGYALNQRTSLENVLLDGRLELSNNRCERSIKPFVMGRKAWLFSNTPEGAYASSVMYSIIETAKENGLHPYHYVKYLLEVLPSVDSDDIEDFMPWSESIPDWCKVNGGHK